MLQRDLAFGLIFVGTLGCSPNVYSPPGRAAVLERARPIGEGAWSAGASAGVHSAPFGPSAAAVSAEVHHGVHPGVEVSGQATLARITESGQTESSRNIGMGRLAGKVGNEWFAIGVGAFGGGSAGGPYMGGDTTLLLSLPNRWVIPTVHVGGLMSQPLSASEVRFTEEDGTPVVDTPQRTWGLNLGVSLHVPLPFGQEAATHAIAVGLSTTTLNDGYDDDMFIGLSLGYTREF